MVQLPLAPDRPMPIGWPGDVLDETVPDVQDAEAMKCPKCECPMPFEDYPRKRERMWVCLNPDCTIRAITEYRAGEEK